jgi:TrmH family RNA methyltransferase
LNQHITSRQNARVKDAARLRLGRQRQRQGRFLIDGAREILRAIDAGIEIVEAFVCEPLVGETDSREAAAALANTQAALATVTEDVYEKLRYGDRAGGLVAVAKTPRRTLGDLQLPPAPLVAVLEALEKPGNVGAVLRSADGAGLDAVIVADPRCDLFNPNTIRASLGTVFDANVCTASSDDTLAWLAEKNVPIVAARVDAAMPYDEFNYRSGAAIVLGSEADGLSEKWHAPNVTAVKLPMYGAADSLNVSAAAAVLFYEARRQRDLAPGQ